MGLISSAFSLIGKTTFLPVVLIGFQVTLLHIFWASGDAGKTPSIPCIRRNDSGGTPFWKDARTMVVRLYYHALPEIIDAMDGGGYVGLPTIII